MDAIADTLAAVDDRSKKMAYTHFDQEETNILAAESAGIIKKIN